MTYNFDADAWFDRELEALHFQRDAGTLSPDQYERLLAELEARYDEMVAGFDSDGAYCVM